MPVRLKIHVLSFDADGCLFHARYRWNWNDLNPENQNKIIATNKEFLDSIKSNSSQYDTEFVLNGSARQTAFIDDINATNPKNPEFCTESCFTALQKVCTYIGVPLNKFLLPDAYDNIPDGTTFDEALLALDERTPPMTQSKQYPRSTFISDVSKLTLLYAQMHKVAKENPHDDVIFDFYDDKGKNKNPNFRLLDDLYAFFELYPEMIPRNVTLRLNKYVGKGVTPYSPIKGYGVIDTHYKSTIKQMVTIAKRQNPELFKRRGVVQCVTSVAPYMLNIRNTLSNHINRGFFKPCNTHNIGLAQDTSIFSRHGTMGTYNPYKASFIP